MEVLYLDVWFALNLLCDYLLCLLTARAAGLYLKRRRYALAALLGAAYACAAWLPGFAFLALPGWRLAVGALMGLLAFGSEQRPFRCILLFFAVSAAFGGALTVLSRQNGGPLRLSVRGLLLSFLLCYGVGALLFRCHALLLGRQTCSVAVEHCGRHARFRALHDTGNGLRDPISGERVLIASPHALKEILRENTALFLELDPVQLQELSAQIPELAGRLRLLPYSAVGGRGLLPVFRPDRLLIDDSESREYLIAISPQVVGEGFDAIL